MAKKTLPKNPKKSVRDLTLRELYRHCINHRIADEVVDKANFDRSSFLSELIKRKTTFVELRSFKTELEAQEHYGDQFDKIPERVKLTVLSPNKIYEAIQRNNSNYSAALDLGTDGATLRGYLKTREMTFISVKGGSLTEFLARVGQFERGELSRKPKRKSKKLRESGISNVSFNEQGGILFKKDNKNYRLCLQVEGSTQRQEVESGISDVSSNASGDIFFKKDNKNYRLRFFGNGRRVENPTEEVEKTLTPNILNGAVSR